MAKKPNLTTKPQYETGYEAAKADQPRRSPHREGTVLTDIWFVGYDAFLDGGAPPEEPRKKRTKVEMEEDKISPPEFTLPTSLIMRRKYASYVVAKPREDGWLENLFKAKEAIKTETDPELLELLHMEIADLNWIIDVQDGPKPSTIWEEYKTEHGLNFDLNAA